MQVGPVLESVAHADLRHDSLARVDWHPECEAAVNEQIKCVKTACRVTETNTGIITYHWIKCVYEGKVCMYIQGLHTHTCTLTPALC